MSGSSAGGEREILPVGRARQELDLACANNWNSTETIRRLLGYVKLELAELALEGKPLQVWSKALDLAADQGRLTALYGVLLAEPISEELSIRLRGAKNVALRSRSSVLDSILAEILTSLRSHIRISPNQIRELRSCCEEIYAELSKPPSVDEFEAKIEVVDDVLDSVMLYEDLLKVNRSSDGSRNSSLSPARLQSRPLREVSDDLSELIRIKRILAYRVRRLQELTINLFVAD